MAETHSGRKVILIMAAIATAVTLFFVVAVSRNMDLIRYAVKMNRSLPPVVNLPSGDLVLAMEGRRPAFYIDKTEVSQRSYAEFLRARGEPAPASATAEAPATGIPAALQEQFCAWAEKRPATDVELRSTFGPSPDKGFRCARSLPAQ